MVYKPQNVYPHNNTIDASVQNTFTFQFNGSHVICWDYVFYNANNNKVVRRSYKNMKNTNIFNQEKASTPIKANTFKNGYNYKYRMNIYQEKFDIFVMQGTVREITETQLSSNQIPISYGIDNIREPIYYDINGISTLIGACYMEVDNGTCVEKRMITKYNPNIKYGSDDGYGNYDYRTYVEVNVPFTITPSAGTTYRIYCNYVTSPEYYFQCRKTPIIKPVARLNEWGNIECSSTYYQEQYVDVKCYQYSLYKKQVNKIVLDTVVANYVDTDLEEYTSLNSIPLIRDHETTSPVIGDINYYLTVTYNIGDGVQLSDTKPVDHFDFKNDVIYLKENLSEIPPTGATALIFMGHEIMINQSDVIYNQRLTYEFNDIVRNIDYRVLLKVTTQDNMEVENSVSGVFNSISTHQNGDYVSCELDNNDNSVIINYKINKQGNVLISKEDIVTGEMHRFVSGGHPCKDHLIASGKSYRYHITSIVEDEGIWKYGDEYITNSISPDWCCWTLTALQHTYEPEPLEPNKELFRSKDCWKLYIGVEESEFTQNINNIVHVGYSSKPKVTKGANNYLSGHISCQLSQLIPPSDISDTIYLVESWRKFITQNTLFLLKNPKGDVLVISISESPTTTYEYETRRKLTKVSFSFTEVRNINDIAIL